jgi:hypothetical protein
MNNFKLSGDNIELRYQDNALHIQSKNMPLTADGKTFASDSIDISDTDLGEKLTIVLLSSDRVGRKYVLHLIVPKTSPSQNDVPIDGAAILVTDHGGTVGGSPPALQSYDVRHLTGTMSGGGG